jgi:F-type H+-transporting ATPase subunit epsilon
VGTTLKLSVFTPEKKLLETVEVDEVTLPGSEGQIQVLPGHAAMVGGLETGVFSFLKAGSSSGSAAETGVVSTGYFTVQEDQLTVLAETLELRQGIDIERARKAQKKAEDALKAADLDPSNFRKYQLKLERALIRQQVAGK